MLTLGGPDNRSRPVRRLDGRCRADSAPRRPEGACGADRLATDGGGPAQGRARFIVTVVTLTPVPEEPSYPQLIATGSDATSSWRVTVNTVAALQAVLPHLRAEGCASRCYKHNNGRRFPEGRPALSERDVAVPAEPPAGRSTTAPLRPTCRCPRRPARGVRADLRMLPGLPDHPDTPTHQRTNAPPPALGRRMNAAVEWFTARPHHREHRHCRRPDAAWPRGPAGAGGWAGARPGVAPARRRAPVPKAGLSVQLSAWMLRETAAVAVSSGVRLVEPQRLFIVKCRFCRAHRGRCWRLRGGAEVID
jgi:hypothetical protein